MFFGFCHHAARVVVYVVLTTSLLSTFLMNWSFLDGNDWNSLQSALDRSAHKPVIYRRLMPEAVVALRQVLPAPAQAFLGETVAPRLYHFYAQPLARYHEPELPGLASRAARDWQSAEYRVSYALMYLLCWGFLFLALHLLRLTALRLEHDAGLPPSGVGEWAPLYAVLLLPLSFLNGGYHYDFAELALLTMAVHASLCGRFGVLVVALMLAVLNKETAWMFTLFLAPLWLHRWGAAKTWLRLGGLTALLMAVSWSIQRAFESNPGVTVGLALPANLAFWSSPQTWWAIDDHIGRGIFLPRLLLLLALPLALVYGWRLAPRPLALAACSAVAASVLLLLCFGFRDELRNLSLAFPLTYAVVVSAYLEWRRRTAAGHLRAAVR